MLRKVLFNLWYFFKPPWDTGTTPPEVIEFIEENPPGRALDLGCGTGTNVITLANYGWDAVGIDFARLAIKIARRKAERAGVDVKFYVDNVTNLKHVSGSFDLILDIGCYHSIANADRKDYLHKLHDLIAEHGNYMLYAFLKAEHEEGTGIVESEIDEISQNLDLFKRMDGSERGIRPSTWLIFGNQ